MAERDRSSDRLLSGAELARRLGVDARTIRKWRTEPGFPVAVRGRGTAPSKYDETAVRAWIQQREQGARSDTRLLIKARVRKESAIAAESELRYALRSGAVIPTDTVDRIWSGQVAAVRAHLLSWETALADRVHRAAVLDGVSGVERVLHEEVYRVLTELSTGKALRTRRTTKAAALAGPERS